MRLSKERLFSRTYNGTIYSMLILAIIGIFVMYSGYALALDTETEEIDTSADDTTDISTDVAAGEQQELDQGDETQYTEQLNIMARIRTRSESVFGEGPYKRFVSDIVALTSEVLGDVDYDGEQVDKLISALDKLLENEKNGEVISNLRETIRLMVSAELEGRDPLAMANEIVADMENNGIEEAMAKLRDRYGLDYEESKHKYQQRNEEKPVPPGQLVKENVQAKKQERMQEKDQDREMIREHQDDQDTDQTEEAEQSQSLETGQEDEEDGDTVENGIQGYEEDQNGESEQKASSEAADEEKPGHGGATGRRSQTGSANKKSGSGKGGKH